MKNIIEKVVDIDKKALDIKQKTEEMIEASGKRLNKRLAEIEEKEMIKAKEMGKIKYDKLLEIGNNESIQIEALTKRECEKLEESFSRIHKRLEKEIFNRLFNDSCS